MKPRAAKFPAAAFTAALAIVTTPLIGLSQTPPYNATSISGGYTLRMSGIAYEPSGYQDLIVEVGQLTADGNGSVSGGSTLSLNGSIIRRAFTGTYSVNPDGTGSMSLYPNWGPVINVDIVVGAGGREVTFVLTDNSNVLSGTMQAQIWFRPASPPQPYDVTALSGGYELNIAGYAYDSSGSADPINEVGRLYLDGSGGITGAGTVTLGFIVRRTFTGNYSLNADGTGSMVLFPSWGPPIHADIVASAKGAKVEFVLTDPTNVLAGTLKAQTPPVQ